MLQLIYTSISNQPVSGAQLIALCRQGSARNVASEITGVLLIDGMNFLQVLEGPKDVVEDTFLRIVVDDRHGAIMLLSRTTGTRRQFGEWAMARPDTSGEQRRTVDLVRSRLVISSGHLLAMFDARFPAVTTPAITGPAIPAGPL